MLFALNPHPYRVLQKMKFIVIALLFAIPLAYLKTPIRAT